MEFREDATYLLAGGLGGLGRSISRWMVNKGARNLVYVSRSGASSAEARELLEELRSAGANTKVIKCDITDRKALFTALANVLETMPAIRGVIQGAMDLKDQIFTNMSHEAFTACLRPKVQGSWSLHTATLDQPLDFFVLLSSCASFWGNAGQSNYAAGCAYQVALAAHRRSLGLPGSAIDVGKVANVGFVADKTGTVSEQNLVKLGLVDVSEEELLTMIELAILPGANVRDRDIPNGHLLTGVHSTKDANKGEELPFWSRDPVFSHMDFVRPHLQKKNEGGERGQASGQEQKPLPALLGSAQSAPEAESFMLQALLQKLGRALMMPVDDIDASKPTSAYGVDSLIAVELRNWLSREAKVDVPVFDILQATSLCGLAAKLVTRTPLVKVDA
jgi:short-subunit dehydrogenase